MAYNTGGYNPYNTFRTSYVAYNPSTTAFNLPTVGNTTYGNTAYGNTGWTQSNRYQQPGGYRNPYTANNRFQTPNYNYGVQNRYGYNTPYASRYTAPRPYYEEPPQVIYMQQPTPVKKSAWDWKKFAMSAGAVATGLGVFFLMAKNVAKIEINNMIKNELPETLTKLATRFVENPEVISKAKTVLNDVAGDVLEKQKPALQKMARETTQELLDTHVPQLKRTAMETVQQLHDIHVPKLQQTARETVQGLVDTHVPKLQRTARETVNDIILEQTPKLKQTARETVNELVDEQIKKAQTMIHDMLGITAQEAEDPLVRAAKIKKLQEFAKKAPELAEQVQTMITTLSGVAKDAPHLVEQVKGALHDILNSRSYKLFTWTNGSK